MDERMRRLWAGTEAGALGYGGVAAVARATGLAISTVRKGRDEARAGARPDGLALEPDPMMSSRFDAAQESDPMRSFIRRYGLALERLLEPVTRG